MPLSSSKDEQRNSGVNLNLIQGLFIAILILSLFTVAKSFIAAHSVEQWADDIQRMFKTEQAEAGKQSYPIEIYMERLDGIQQQWTVMRYVSAGLAITACYGIFATRKGRGRFHAS